MIVQSSAPLRISLFGGGTDLPNYYEKFGGITIDIAVNLRQHISLYTSEDIFGYSSQYGKDSFPIGGNPKFLYTIAKELGLDGGHQYKIRSTCDGFLNAGLGSSAAAAVALIGAIAKTKGIFYTKEQIANAAYFAETNTMGWYGGKQDQFSSVYGGAHVFEFMMSGVHVTPIHKDSITPILESMVLFYIGPKKEKHMQEQLRELSKEQIETLHVIKELATGSLSYIGKGDYVQTGKLLHTYWKLKKKINTQISTSEVDTIYDFASKHGSYGGKICGSGSGGYMFFMVDPEKREDFINKMKEINLEEVDFSISWDGLQTRRL